MKLGTQSGVQDSSRRSWTVGKGCLIAFLVPFLGIFLLVLVSVIRGIGEVGAGVWIWVPLLVLGGFFIGVPAALIYVFRDRKARKEREQRFPDQPWLWRADWADGQMRFKEGDWIARWVFAIVWTGLSTALLLPLFREALEKQEWIALIFLVFPIIGLFMMIWAARATWRHLRYGVSTFDLESNPGVVGGFLRGRVKAKLRLRPGERVQVQLTHYERHTSRSGKSRSTHYRVLWRDKKELGPETLSRGAHGVTVVPVEFFIPRTCGETQVFGHEDGPLWRLEVSAAVPGVRYTAHFDVPVFRTAESDSEEAHRLTERAEQQVLTQERPPAVAARITNPPTGGTEYFWGPQGLFGLSFVLALAFAGLGAYLYFSLAGVDMGIPDEDRLGARVIVGFMMAGLALIVIGLWTSASRLVVEQERVRVLKRIFGLGSWKEYPATEIREVQSFATHSSGKKNHFRIRLTLADGKTIDVGNGADTYEGGQWLAAQIREQLQPRRR
jgi:translation initiation factor IF-1